MLKLKRLAFNTAMLTVSSLLMQFLGLAFQVWLVGRIGSSGIGLFGLVMSVNALASTVAVSGIRFACTRLISEELGLDRPGSVRRAMRRCLAYSLFFGLAAAAVLFCFAEPIGFLWVGDARTVLPLRLLALSLPLMSLSSVIAGYFTACTRVYKAAVVQVAEQLSRMAFVAVFLSMAPYGDLELSCAAVVLGGCCGEAAAFILSLILYIYDRKRHYSPNAPSGIRLTPRLLGISIPLALSAYARTSLSTIQHLLVPRGLRASGMSADSALSGYGIIQGMVFPIIMFPSCLLAALSQMLVPELTAAQVSGKDSDISDVASMLLNMCLRFSIGAAILMASFSSELGIAVYGSAESGKYIMLFSLLVPVMYMDMVTDGCLKGLGQMMHSMGINIADALIGVILVWLLLPRYALGGYIFMIFVTECFNFSLSIGHLHRVAQIRISLPDMILSAVCALGASQMSAFIFSLLGFDPAGGKFPLIIAIAAAAAMYMLLIKLLHCGPRYNGANKTA